MDQTLTTPIFFQKNFQHTEEIGNADFIISGDFNLVLDPEKDSSDYKNINNPKARDRLIEFMEINHVTNPFHENNPQLKRYTWRRRNPLK